MKQTLFFLLGLFLVAGCSLSDRMPPDNNVQPRTDYTIKRAEPDTFFCANSQWLKLSQIQIFKPGSSISTYNFDDTLNSVAGAFNDIDFQLVADSLQYVGLEEYGVCLNVELVINPRKDYCYPGYWANGFETYACVDIECGDASEWYYDTRIYVILEDYGNDYLFGLGWHTRYIILHPRSSCYSIPYDIYDDECDPSWPIQQPDCGD